MQRGEAIRLDELFVREHVAGQELDLADDLASAARRFRVVDLTETQLLEPALDRLAEHAMRMRVDRRRRSGLAYDRDERPARLAFPVREPSTAFAVTERARARG